jgi:uncharacterized protein YdhG (YjbR/CyaY superfamily)
MAATKSAKVTPKKSKGKGFTDAEKSAMRARIKELQSGGGDLEGEVLAKIQAMGAADRAMATRIHQIVKATAPELTSRLYYGMPAYAKNGKTICFYKPAEKFRTRYAELGFNQDAHLDDGAIWPISWALTKLTATEEAKVKALIKQAVS